MAVQYSTEALSELNSKETTALHALMAKLNECGVGTIIDIPQMIVVGAQAAGKSSVLEAISGVKFPIAAGLCTRFATEIILDRAAQDSVHVSIRVHPDEPKPQKKFDESRASKEDLPALINEAKGCMGITENSTGFSRHVLCVQIKGPGIYPLRLVDLPGIFTNEVANQSEKGIDIVNKLVESYMEQKSSIILVVVEAKTEIVSHIALAKARKYDPKRERTLGIITKPDINSGEHLQKSHIELAKNRETAHYLKLGWHVLRNKAENGESADTRDATEEDFFKNSAWSCIIEKDRGIHSLRRKLSGELYKHIRRSLPKVIEDIETNLSQREIERDQLGMARTSIEDKRVFLADIAEQFQRLVRDAMRGNYLDEFFGQLTTPQHRLRAELWSFHRAFDHTMTTRGHKLDIESHEDETVPAELVDFLKRNPYNFDAPSKKSREDVNKMLLKPILASEGSGLPSTYNSEVATYLFHHQSSPWKGIAKFHLESVLETVRTFIEQLFAHIIGRETDNLDAISSEYIDPFFDKQGESLQTKLEELIAPYIKGYAVPSYTEFRRTVREWTSDHVLEQLENLKVDGDDDAFRIRYLDAADELADIVDGGNLGTDRIVSMMQAYYEISRRTFIDNITNLAVEGCLVQHLPGIFTSRKVAALDDMAVKRLGFESESVESRRGQLAREVAALKTGLEQCRRWRPRTDHANVDKQDMTNDDDDTSVPIRKVAVPKPAARDGPSAVVKKPRVVLPPSSDAAPTKLSSSTAADKAEAPFKSSSAASGVPAAAPTVAAGNLFSRKAEEAAGFGSSFGSKAEEAAGFGSSFGSKAEEPAGFGSSLGSKAEKPTVYPSFFSRKEEEPAGFGSSFGSKTEKPAGFGSSLGSKGVEADAPANPVFATGLFSNKAAAPSPFGTGASTSSASIFANQPAKKFELNSFGSGGTEAANTTAKPLATANKSGAFGGSSFRPGGEV